MAKKEFLHLVEIEIKKRERRNKIREANLIRKGRVYLQRERNRKWGILNKYGEIVGPYEYEVWYMDHRMMRIPVPLLEGHKINLTALGKILTVVPLDIKLLILKNNPDILKIHEGQTNNAGKFFVSLNDLSVVIGLLKENNTNNWLDKMFPQQGQEELFANGILEFHPNKWHPALRLLKKEDIVLISSVSITRTPVIK